MNNNKGSYAAAAALVVALATWSGSVLADDASWHLGVQWQLSFGSERTTTHQWDMGSAFRLPAFVDAGSTEQLSPYSGLQYRTHMGWQPAVAGVPWQSPRVQGLATEDGDSGDGRSAIWVGLAIAGGVLAALALAGHSVEVNNGSADVQTGSGNGATDENTCIGPDLDNPEHYDTDCVGG